MQRYTIKDLIFLMQQLRNTEHGCPWDVKQTFETIARYTIEEAYEVADAITSKDFNHLKEELGDLLLQVIFHAQMADEKSLFNFNDVVHTLVTKLIRRHPHVFPEGDLYAPLAKSTLTDDQVKNLWEKIKQQEEKERQEKNNKSGLLTGVARALPALKRAQKIQEKAAHHGFDWQEAQPVFAKLREESDELEQACKSNNAEATEEEFGDLLFTMVNLSRHLQLNAEQSLDKACHKFIKRFAYIEEKLAQQEKTVNACSPEELDLLWNEAKQFTT